MTTMSATAVRSIGRQFVEQYYTLLYCAPNFLHRFYWHDSSFAHSDADDHEGPAIGQAEIGDRIARLNLSNCMARLHRVDIQALLSSSIVVQVIGELSNSGGPMRRFTQTFVLALQSSSKYYVHNDIFRYDDSIFSSRDDTFSTATEDTVRGGTVASEACASVAVSPQPLSSYAGTPHMHYSSLREPLHNSPTIQCSVNDGKFVQNTTSTSTALTPQQQNFEQSHVQPAMVSFPQDQRDQSQGRVTSTLATSPLQRVPTAVESIPVKDNQCLVTLIESGSVQNDRIIVDPTRTASYQLEYPVPGFAVRQPNTVETKSETFTGGEQQSSVQSDSIKHLVSDNTQSDAPSEPTHTTADHRCLVNVMGSDIVIEERIKTESMDVGVEASKASDTSEETPSSVMSSKPVTWAALASKKPNPANVVVPLITPQSAVKILQSTSVIGNKPQRPARYSTDSSGWSEHDGGGRGSSRRGSDASDRGGASGPHGVRSTGDRWVGRPGRSNDWGVGHQDRSNESRAAAEFVRGGNKNVAGLPPLYRCEQQLFLGNLPHDITPEGLTKFIEGTRSNVKVLQIEIKESAQGPDHRVPYFAFATLDSVDSVNRILDPPGQAHYLDGTKHRINITRKLPKTELYANKGQRMTGTSNGFGGGGGNRREHFSPSCSTPRGLSPRGWDDKQHDDTGDSSANSFHRVNDSGDISRQAVVTEHKAVHGSTLKNVV